jgi:hypothetical protein
MPFNLALQDNMYIAVAYQDRWYPGCVVQCKTDSTAVVKFMAPCRQPGQFKWPSREDVQDVHIQFILKAGFIPE